MPALDPCAGSPPSWLAPQSCRTPRHEWSHSQEPPHVRSFSHQRGKMSQAVIDRKVALLAVPSLSTQSAIEASLKPATRNRKGIPEDPFRYEFDLFSSCSCAQAKRVRAEMTSENSYWKRYRDKMTTNKTPTLRFVAASLI